MNDDLIYVYVLRLEDVRKIGSSKDPYRRMAQIQKELNVWRLVGFIDRTAISELCT